MIFPVLAPVQIGVECNNSDVSVLRLIVNYYVIWVESPQPQYFITLNVVLYTIHYVIEWVYVRTVKNDIELVVLQSYTVILNEYVAKLICWSELS